MTVEQQITFMYVSDLDRAHSFYGEVLGLEMVLDQQGLCRIYRVTESSFVGLCAHRPEKVGIQGALLTVVTADVDLYHSRLVAAGATITRAPSANAEFGIYNFFAEDPDGNQLEVQHFDDPGWMVADT